jgi:putative colanic acid biosynthesis acetyltransferase WcaF
VVLGGARVGRNCVITPLSVVDARPVPAGEIWGGNPLAYVGDRVIESGVRP